MVRGRVHRGEKGRVTEESGFMVVRACEVTCCIHKEEEAQSLAWNQDQSVTRPQDLVAHITQEGSASQRFYSFPKQYHQLGTQSSNT